MSAGKQVGGSGQAPNPQEVGGAGQVLNRQEAPKSEERRYPSEQDLDLALARADALLDEGKEQEAFELLRQAATTFPADDASVFAQGVILDRWERRDEAALAMEEALRRNPGNLPAAISLAGLLFEAGDAMTAMQTIHAAVASEPLMDSTLHERFLVLQSMVEHDALEQLLIHFSQCEAGFCNDKVLRGIARHIGVLLGRRIESCRRDPALRDGFLCSSESGLLRAAVIDGVELVVMDSADEVLLRRPLLLPTVDSLKAKPSRLPEGMVETTLSFPASGDGTRKMLEYVSVVAAFLAAIPDLLEYDILGAKRWEEHIDFEPRAWKQVFNALSAGKPWRLRGRFETRQYCIELSALQDEGGTMLVRSDPERVEKLLALYQKLMN
ncbi:MAG: hypothetical protein RBU37_01110 [Myxococcota bacterium]|jgi:hypothetical protein|nr:hypothetical protein [Myxococcota bacterium]